MRLGFTDSLYGLPSLATQTETCSLANTWRSSEILYCEQRRQRSRDKMNILSGNPSWDFLSADGRCWPRTEGHYLVILWLHQGCSWSSILNGDLCVWILVLVKLNWFWENFVSVFENSSNKEYILKFPFFFGYFTLEYFLSIKNGQIIFSLFKFFGGGWFWLNISNNNKKSHE